MRNRKFGLRALGLAFVAALSLMALAAAGAQAALPAESVKGLFSINGSTATLLATATGAQEGSGILLVAGRNLDIKCTSADVIGKSEIINKEEALVEVLFLGCAPFIHKTENPVKNCHITNGLTILATALALPIKHGGEKFVLFEGDPASKAFALFEFDKGVGCALPTHTEVSGSVGAKVIQSESVIQLIEFSQAIQELLGDKLLYGTFPAFVNASATVELTGASHAGLKFGVV